MAHDFSARTKSADVAVVGGGVIGLSCVLHLLEANPHLNITVVDAPTRPGVASRAAAGMLAPFAELHEESPLFNLCREGYDYYAEFLERFRLSESGGPSLHSPGVLIPSNGEFAPRAERIVPLAKQYATAEEIDTERLYKAEPLLRGGKVTSAWRLPGSLIDPVKLHEKLRQRAVEMGAQILEEQAVGLDLTVSVNGDGTTIARGVLLKDKTHVSCGTLLIASGAWSATLGRLLGIELDIVPVKGQLGRYVADDGALRHILHCHDIYLAPRAGKGILFGATTEEKGFEEGIDEALIRGLQRKVEEIVPSFAGQPPAETWYGFRPRFRDGSPAIGWSTKARNVLLATGHYRNGILLTAITGRIIAEAFREGPAHHSGAFHDPARLGL